MNFGSLLLGFGSKLRQFKPFLPHLDVVTEEENSEEKAKSKEIKSNFERLFMYSKMAGLGRFLAKDKDIKKVFIQNKLLVLLIHKRYPVSRPLSKYQSECLRVKFFFVPIFSRNPLLKRMKVYIKLIFNFH